MLTLAMGLLGQTLVVLGTEFGRTLRINDKDGRDNDDEVVGCLLADLQTEGLLDQTMVVLGAEFCATPLINNGRDHHNEEFIWLLADHQGKGPLDLTQGSCVPSLAGRRASTSTTDASRERRPSWTIGTPTVTQ